MKKLKHKGSCKETHPKMSHKEWEEDQEDLITGEEEEEIEELVDFDGSILGSKIPMGWENNKTISATKTMDQTVPMGRQGSRMSGYGTNFTRYWGESVEELGEEDMSPVLGAEETQTMDAGGTIEYFMDELGMDKEEAVERTEKLGKTKDLDKKGPTKSSNFQRLVEDEDVMKMLEIILNTKDEDSDIQKVDSGEIPPYIDKKLRLIQKYARNHGYDMKNIVNRLKDE